MLFMRIILGVACASHVRATKREELVTDEAKRVNVTPSIFFAGAAITENLPKNEIRQHKFFCFTIMYKRY